jgi:hypothetical protein
VYVLDKISGCSDKPWGPWISTKTAPKCTAAVTGLFFALQRRRVAWGVTRLVAQMVIYSGNEKQRKLKYSKITAASAQNGDFYCKKWSFALLLLTNPLPLTILNNVSMGLVAIGGPLALTLG